MAKLGIHKRGHGKEQLHKQSVSHHSAKDAFSGMGLQTPMTSPVHPDLNSLAGGPTAPSSTQASDSDVSAPTPAASAPEMGASPGTPATSGMGFKKGGSVKWIQSAIKKPGSLRKSLHVKAGEKIPAKKLASAAKKSGVMGKRARLAETLKSFKK
jgi:hypothetical protein